MILKRLKLFTGEGASGIPLQSAINKSQADFNKATNFSNVKLDGSAITNATANTGAANTGNNAGGSGAGNAAASANTSAAPKPGANATTNAANSNAANSGSVMQKQSYDKPNVSTNNVKSDTAQTLYKEQLNNANKAHQQELKSAIAQSSKRGEQAGMRKAGVWQGLKNTWRSAGTMKKIGMGGAALAGTYFLGKGLLGGNNNNNDQ